MAYTYKDAIKTAYKYLHIEEDKVEIIEKTNGRGIVYEFDGIKTVIFIYPISCKQKNKQNFFDTRDSGAKERALAWTYAKEQGLKYFCLGFNEEQERYKEYVLSLESDEISISNISFRKAADSETTGTQVNIPNDFIPKKNFERIKTPKGFYISAIQKEYIGAYIKLFDNRPYMFNLKTVGEKRTVVFETKIQTQYKRNRILFGAPGTGKSFTLNDEKGQLLGVENDINYERVTFHPDYSYANFVGTYKPTMVKRVSFSDDNFEPHQLDGTDAVCDGKAMEQYFKDINNSEKEIAYEYVPGPFMRVLVKALKSAMSENPKPYLLIVEEINRANVAAVFGEVFQLLDRSKNGVSEYAISTSNNMRAYLAQELGVDESSVEKIKIPDNMFIWATMNSADQGVFPMDTAFKRRWDFTYLGIDDAVEKFSDKIINKKYVLGMGVNARLVNWNDLREAINDVLSSELFNINEDKLLGPYFISNTVLEGDDDKDFIDVFKNKVLMYLFDDVVKQKKNKFFEECRDGAKGVRYSDICKGFDTKGVFIFPTEISKRFGEKPKEESTEASDS